MTKVFHPQRFIMVKASSPHPDDTEYKVSLGTEFWDDYPATVIKVQMVYGGKVEGRRSPSYPLGTDDFERVNEAVQNLISGK